VTVSSENDKDYTCYDCAHCPKEPLIKCDKKLDWHIEGARQSGEYGGWIRSGLETWEEYERLMTGNEYGCVLFKEKYGRHLI